MIRDLPGTKPSALLGPILSNYLPDPRFPTVADNAFRNQFYRSTLTGASQYSTEPLRVSGITLGGQTPGALVSVTVSADGVNLTSTASVRADDNGTAYNPAVQHYVLPVPAGLQFDARAVVDTEPYVFVPKAQPVVLQGKNRLRIHKRRLAEAANQTLGILTTGRRGSGRDARGFRVNPDTGARVSRGGLSGQDVIIDPKPPGGGVGGGGGGGRTITGPGGVVFKPPPGF